MVPVFPHFAFPIKKLIDGWMDVLMDDVFHPYTCTRFTMFDDEECVFLCLMLLLGNYFIDFDAN